jgi:HD-GYP domain-containing protein (c-di-GMP phosphodiesterase class II)
MKRMEIVPQQVTIAAPIEFVFEMLATVDYECRPGSGRSVSRIGSGSQRTVAAFASVGIQGQTHTVKEIVATPPDRLTYTHMSGPYAGATEEILLRGNGTFVELLLSAQFKIAASSPHRLLKLTFEHLAQEHLRDIKEAAEARTRPVDHTGGPASMLVHVPSMTTEAQLLDAVDVQEEAEWGHVGHGRGVARVAVSLAESVMLPQRQIDNLMRAALLHDVGKVALDSSLWGTRGTLTPLQREKMAAHPRLGHELAARAGLSESILTAILHHHERWDGLGYPERLAGEAIPLRARILCIAENVDSMMRASYRREVVSTHKVATMMEEDDGQQWDPMLARRTARIIRGK